MTRQHLACASTALLTALLCGCGGPATITGTVTYDGALIEKGAITFVPVDGIGPSVGGQIAAGKYRVEGVVLGPKVVKIEAVKKVPFARSSAEMARMAEEARARGDKTGLIDSADVVPADAVGNNATVEVRDSSPMDFHLQPPVRGPR